MRMLGNIAIVPADLPDNPGVVPPRALTPGSGTWIAYIKGAEYIDNVTLLDRDDMRLWSIVGCKDNPPAGAFCDWGIGLDPNQAPLVARHNTGWGGNGQSNFSGWTDEDRLVVPFGSPVSDVFLGTAGARVCHRYVDGELRDGSAATAAEPLWPWPMNARILAATTAAVGHSPEDVMQRVEALLGPIPAACRAASAVAPVPMTPAWGLVVLAALLVRALHVSRSRG